MRRAIFAATLVAIIVYIYYSRQSPTHSVVSSKAVDKKPPVAPVRPTAPVAASSQPQSQPQQLPPQPLGPRPTRAVKDKTGKQLALPYKIVNGMFIVHGDIVAGAVIKGDDPPLDGLVELEPLRLWPNVIPYHIQPYVTHKDRIYDALKMFEGTAVQFVPEAGQNDVLVFEAGEQNCFSYLGKVVDKQQIWISPECAASDIAHEILHALGFVHEQNRADRDDYILVFPENIEDEYRFNFDKLPQEYMRVSGLLPFDFKSLMMYPASMFAKGGRQTMEPKDRDQMIDPQPRLSATDIQRLNKIYAGRSDSQK